MISNKVTFISVSIIVIFILIFLYVLSERNESIIVLNGKVFQIEVVRSQSELGRGLSGYKPLKNDEGMLFIFPRLGNYGFWMNNMTFPIDIIWFDSSFKVVHIEKSLSTTTHPKIFYSNSQTLYVLEISAGVSDEINLKIGDIAEFVKK